MTINFVIISPRSPEGDILAKSACFLSIHLINFVKALARLYIQEMVLLVSTILVWACRLVSSSYEWIVRGESPDVKGYIGILCGGC